MFCTIYILAAKRDGNEWIYFDKSLVNQSFYMKDEYIIIPINAMENVNIAKKIEKGTNILKNYANVNFGMQLRNRKIYVDDVTSDQERLTKYHKPCYTGKDIDEYHVSYNGLYCYFNRDEAKCGGCWDEVPQFANPKLLVRQIGVVPIVGLDEKGYAVLNTAFMISGFKEGISPYFLLGLLNSKLIRFYWLQTFSDNRKQFPKIKGTYLEKVPVKRNEDYENRIEVLVKKIIASNNDIVEMVNEIDVMVYAMYGMTDEEIVIIEKNTCEA